MPEPAPLGPIEEPRERAGSLDPVPEEHDGGREKGEAGSHRHQHHEDSAQPHGDDGGLACGEEGREADDDGKAGEGDRLPGVCDHLHRSVFDVAARPPLAPEPGQHEEGVVDADSQAEHDGEGLKEDRQVHPLTNDEGKGQGDDDGEDSQEEREGRCGQSPEHRDQHHERHGQTDHLRPRRALPTGVGDLGMHRLHPGD